MIARSCRGSSRRWRWRTPPSLARPDRSSSLVQSAMTKAVALLLAAFGAAAGQSAPRFDLPRMPVLTDQVVPIAMSGLTPGHSLTITLRGLGFVSHAAFVADSAGRVDLMRMAPKSGYDGVEPMGLFWFAERETQAIPREMITVNNPPPEIWQLTAEQDGAVIATSPSNVVVHGCCSDRFANAWRLDGAPVPRAEIPVENIHGPVLLISGRDDGVWPSTRSAESIVRRLKEHQFAYEVTCASFPDAGHSLIRPHSPTMDINSRRHPLTGRIVRAGGTPMGNARARGEAWKNVLEFLNAFSSR